MNVIINNMIEYSFYTFVPTPYHNLMHPGPRKSGIDMNKGGCKYNYFGSIGTGLGTAADSMTAIDKVVFQDNACTLEEMVKALADNWEGHEELKAVEQMTSNITEKLISDMESTGILTTNEMTFHEYAEGLKGFQDMAVKLVMKDDSEDGMRLDEAIFRMESSARKKGLSQDTIIRKNL